MKNDVKKDWVEALRSGKYPQTTGYLRLTEPVTEADQTQRPAGYCCLGVLCELAVEAGVVEEYEKHDFANNRGTFVRYDGSSAELPASVVDWAGLDDTNPAVRVADGSLIGSLAEANDHGYDFEAIANLIEEQL